MALRPQHVTQELLNKVTKALGITALDQWYHVSHHAATRAIGTRALNTYGGTLSSFLKSAYPHHKFDEEKLTSRIKLEKDQKFLEVIIRQLFPNVEIQTKARKAVGIMNPETGMYLEIDFWIPSLKLGIEFQDKHHYEYQWYANGALEHYQKRDDLKKVTMSSMGYTLITIGCWWDKTPESVAATIREIRPDLLHEFENTSADPIPAGPPPGFFTESSVIPGIAGLMSPFIPGNDFNPINWYAGEKHDGIRGIYNPEFNKIFSRAGKALSIHPSLLQDIPNMLFEGEIIAGRGNYNKTGALSCHTHHDRVNWPIFRYVLFDIPDAEAGDYSQRYSAIISELSTHPYIFPQLASRVLLANKAHLEELVDAIISDAGEGVIVQQNVQYEYGRAKGLAKIKVRRDADAQVLRANELSCTCKLVSGVTIDIEFSDDFEPTTLNVGDIVSYYHYGYSQSGQPKQAEIYKVRYDVTWEQLTSEEESHNSTKDRSIKDTLGGGSLIVQNTVRNKMGHWNKAQNVRAFLDEFARTSEFDPLVPENWYPIRVTALENAGGSGLLNAYDYSLMKATTYAYPELKFEAEKFMTRANVRAFFDIFAQAASFDPLVPENWYIVKTIALRDAGGDCFLDAFGNSVKKALTHAYPELKFEVEKFRARETIAHKMGHWNKSQNVRAFLVEFARSAGFDPLVPENWYPIRTTSLENFGGSGLLNAYSYNLQKAIAFAFPEVKFETHKFKTRDNIRAKVRTFFDDFARTSGFDSLIPENWYPRMSSLRNVEGGLLDAYGYNPKKALLYAYPELNFDLGRFGTHNELKVRDKMGRGHWDKSQNVRAFFDEFARNAGFDPLVPENWYPIRVSTIAKAGGIGLLKAYDKSVALSFAYPELKFEEGKFKTRDNTRAHLRSFFDEFARKSGFDAQVPENWYPIRTTALRNAGGGGILDAFGYNLKKALPYTYPELKFEDDKLKIHNTTKGRDKLERGHWNNTANVRAFLDGFASAAGFDPLVPENWSPVTSVALRNAKGGGLLSAYGHNIKKALAYAYPEFNYEDPSSGKQKQGVTVT